MTGRGAATPAPGSGPRPRGSTGAGRSARACLPGPPSMIASAAVSASETIHRVRRFEVSSSAGNPSVAMKPGRTSPTWTPFGPLLLEQGVAPPGEGELAGRVGAGAAARDAPGRARDVHDRARARGPQERKQGLGEPDGRVEVQVHRLLDVRVAAVGEGAAPRGAGVVDEHGQGVVVLADVGGDPRRGVVVGEVRRDPRGRDRQRLGQGAQPVLAARDQDELRARLAGEPAGGRLADAARCSGDHRRSAPPAELNQGGGESVRRELSRRGWRRRCRATAAGASAGPPPGG